MTYLCDIIQLDKLSRSYLVQQFIQTERDILNIFEEAKNTSMNIPFTNNLWKVIKVGKPITPFGEPKTDVYVLLQTLNGYLHELKISIKQVNADFLENKVKAERAEQIFGSNWSNIVSSCALSVREEFERKNLVFCSKQGKTNAGSITLGWKLDILNKRSGRLSGLVDINPLEVYSGSCLADNKKHAYVNNEEIQNSGVANYILIVNTQQKINNIDTIFKSLISIEAYTQAHPKIYFAFKALNLRTLDNHKCDGNRSLAVYVNWFVSNGKLTSSLVYNNPLNITGYTVRTKALQCLEMLSIQNTNDINDSNCNSSIYN